MNLLWCSQQKASFNYTGLEKLTLSIIHNLMNQTLFIIYFPNALELYFMKKKMKFIKLFTEKHSSFSINNFIELLMLENYKFPCRFGECTCHILCCCCFGCKHCFRLLWFGKIINTHNLKMIWFNLIGILFQDFYLAAYLSISFIHSISRNTTKCAQWPRTYKSHIINNIQNAWSKWMFKVFACVSKCKFIFNFQQTNAATDIQFKIMIFVRW